LKQTGKRNSTLSKRGWSKEAYSWERTFDSASECISVHSPDYGVKKANRAVSELTGLKKDAILKKRCYEVFHSTNAPRHNCPHQICLKTGQPVSSEFWEACRGLYQQVSVSPIRDDRGKIIGTIHIVRNAVVSKGVHERLFRLFAENARDLIWVTDLKLETTYVNPSVSDILGYSVQEAMALKMDEVFTPASLELARHEFETFLARERAGLNSPRSSRRLALEMLRCDGSSVWVEFHAGFLRDHTAKPIGILSIIRDISDRKTLRDARQTKPSVSDRAADAGGALGSDSGMLSSRQEEVLKFFAQGKATKEIAAVLNISPRTVEFHKYRIMKALKARSGAELFQHAIKMGLIRISINDPDSKGSHPLQLGSSSGRRLE